MNAAMTKAQLSEMQARLAGYRRLCDTAKTNADRQRGISGCKQLVLDCQAILNEMNAAGRYTS